MDLRRFLDLYVSETTEHQRLLQRSLLALEREPESDALDSAFRAAHTLKSLSAAMGYTRVAELAHHLEDRLDEIRRAPGVPSAEVIDDLLTAADALEQATTEAIATAPGESDIPDDSHATGGRAAPPPPADVPTGTAALLLVRLRDDAAIKGARALLIMRALDTAALGSEPAAFDDDFAGDFYIFLNDTLELAAARAAIHSAGDVAAVEVVERTRAVAAPTKHDARGATRQVRVESARVDRLAARVAELSALQTLLLHERAVPPDIAEMLTRMTSLLSDLQHDALALRMVPLRESFERLPRVVRDAARTAGRQVDLSVAGEAVELDREILDEIGEPLVHLLRNAVDHGIEEPAARVVAGKPERGHIEIRAERERSSVRITVQDDGAGIDIARVIAKAKRLGLLAEAAASTSREELLRLLTHPGFSTAEHVSTLSGRGVGMDVVANRIRALGGAMELHTETGHGTAFHIRLPVTLALAQALHVRVGSEDYAIPLTHLAEAVELDGNVISGAEPEQVLIRSERLPLVRLGRLLHVPREGAEQTAVIVGIGARRAAIAFDELLGREQILIKSFEAVNGTLPYFAGATLLADGRPALVLDPLSVL